MRDLSLATPLVRTAFCAIALTIASCVIAPATPSFDPDKAMRALGYKFVGLNVTQLMGPYGAPARSVRLSGQTAHSWEYSTSNLRCQLDAYTRDDGIVVNLGYSGNNGACEILLPRGL